MFGVRDGRSDGRRLARDRLLRFRREASCAPVSPDRGQDIGRDGHANLELMAEHPRTFNQQYGMDEKVPLDETVSNVCICSRFAPWYRTLVAWRTVRAWALQ